MYQQPKIEGKIHLKVALISALVATVILGLVVAIIVAANTRPDADKNEDSTTVVDNGANEANKATAVADKAEGVSNDNKSTGTDSPYSKQAEKKTTTKTTTSKNLPKTGPEELLPLALVGGMLAAYGVSALKVRRR